MKVEFVRCEHDSWGLGQRGDDCRVRRVHALFGDYLGSVLPLWAAMTPDLHDSLDLGAEETFYQYEIPRIGNFRELAAGSVEIDAPMYCFRPARAGESARIVFKASILDREQPDEDNLFSLTRLEGGLYGVDFHGRREKAVAIYGPRPMSTKMEEVRKVWRTPAKHMSETGIKLREWLSQKPDFRLSSARTP